MKIFWDDPQGNVPPEDAIFELYPFFREKFPQIIREKIPSLNPEKKLTLRKKTSLPSFEDWCEKAQYAIDQIRKGLFQKIVLARTVVCECEEEIDPLSILSFLKKRSKNSVNFCLIEDGQAFLGSTPERLFSRKDHVIQTVAMAGTRRRGKTKEVDESLEKELLTSSKDLHEWGFIKTHLQEKLSPFCETPLRFSCISTYKTAYVQHLYSRGESSLLPSFDERKIIEALYPTPALSGMPQEKALSFIQEIEPFERGYFGGVLGWRSEKASEWIVPIRSAKVLKNELHLFSGVGLVKNSNPEEEWEELNMKVQLFEGLFQ